MTTITSSFERQFLATLKALNAPIEYRTDAKGRKVRLPNATHPVTTEETRALLCNMRVVEEADVLEALGKGVLDYMVKAGQLVRDAACKEMLWVSKACAKAYDLPEYLGPRTFVF